MADRLKVSLPEPSLRLLRTHVGVKRAGLSSTPGETGAGHNRTSHLACRLLLGAWLPLARAVFSTVCSVCPSPLQAITSERASRILYGTSGHIPGSGFATGTRLANLASETSKVAMSESELGIGVPAIWSESGQMDDSPEEIESEASRGLLSLLDLWESILICDDFIFPSSPSLQRIPRCPGYRIRLKGVLDGEGKGHCGTE
ncbi:unnamed protein product, partial [Protopolystoma xenopodis]